MINGAGRVEATAEVIRPAELGYKRGNKDNFPSSNTDSDLKKLEMSLEKRHGRRTYVFIRFFFPKALKFLI